MEKQGESRTQKIGCALIVFGVIVGAQVILVKPMIGSIFVAMVAVGVAMWFFGKG